MDPLTSPLILVTGATAGIGAAGTGKDINLFVTELASLDNVQIFVPNAAIWGSLIRNYSRYTTRRIDLAVGIGYGDSIDQAMAAIRAEPPLIEAAKTRGALDKGGTTYDVLREADLVVVAVPPSANARDLRARLQDAGLEVRAAG